MTLTIRQIEAINSSIELRVGYLREILELETRTSADLIRWSRMAEDNPHVSRLSRLLDPETSDVNPSNAYWIYCYPVGSDWEDDRNIVATMVEKLTVTENFIEDVATQRFFYSGAPRLSSYVPNLTEEAQLLWQNASIRGRISWGGGLWVHPSWRSTGRVDNKGIRIGNILPTIGRMRNVTHFRIDGHTSFIQSSPNRRKWSKTGVGNSQVYPLSSGPLPLGRESLNANDEEWRNMDLHYSNRSEIIRQCESEFTENNLDEQFGA